MEQDHAVKRLTLFYHRSKVSLRAKLGENVYQRRYLVVGLVTLIPSFFGIWKFAFAHPSFLNPVSNSPYLEGSLEDVNYCEVEPEVMGEEISEATESASPVVSEAAEIEESDKKNEPAPAPPSSNRLGFPVNKFGVHGFATTEDFDLASQLVNSNGGEWGWYLMTYDIHDRNVEAWSERFDYMKSKHLIPILQLSNNGNIPTDEEIESTTQFLNALRWPVKLRFITAFNEVNASEYWGWKIDPEGYAQVLDKFITAFKGKSGDFFVMNGAFNASARSGHVFTDLGVETDYLSEPDFLRRMNEAVPGIFGRLDGWASHCYPHPGYRGHPLETRVTGEADWEAGRNTMSSYKWELGILNSTYGVNPPVFITETGWPHREGAAIHDEWHPASLVAEYYRIAFRDLWGPDSRVAAITPFILRFGNYDNFAFVGADGSKYPQWDAIVSLPKAAGAPPVN